LPALETISLNRLPHLLLSALLNGMLVATEVAAAQVDEELREIVVIGERINSQAEATEQTEKLNEVPGTFGDALQALFTLPGIVPSLEYGGQPAVRGSGPEDNTYLIDFLPAGYLFHDFGDSVVSDDLLRDFGIHTAGYGGRYGDATGGMFDIRLREPRQRPLRTTAELSFLRLGAMLESEVGQDQSFYVSYRESMLGLVLRTQSKALEDDEDLSFNTYPQARDFTAKYSWIAGPADRLSLLLLGAQDITALDIGDQSDFGLVDPAATGEASIDTGFASAGLRWTHESDRLNTEAGLGVMKLRRRDQLGDANEYAHSSVLQWTLNARAAALLSDRQHFVLGLDTARRDFHYRIQLRYRPCSLFTPDCFTEHGELIALRDSLPLNTTALYAEHIWSPTPVFQLTTGLRESYNRYLGEWYSEPRLAANLDVGSHWSVHAAAGRYHQMPGPAQMAPLLGNPDIDAPVAIHYVLGVKQVLGNGWSWTADGYYKDLRKVIIDAPAPLLYANLATGETWGTELMLDKEQTGRWYGWMSASLARSRRTSNLSGETVRFSFDTPVVITAVGHYQITSNWSAGLRWTFRSGVPYTEITGNHENPDFPGFYLPDYGPVNDVRADDYHRLDLRVARDFGTGKRVQGSFFFDLINAYARNSGGAAMYKPKAGSSDYELEQAKSLPILVSLGVKVSF
jgi:hypothetical protein